MMRATWFLLRVTSYWLSAAHMFYPVFFILFHLPTTEGHFLSRRGYRGQSCEFGFTRGGSSWVCNQSRMSRFRDGLSLVVVKFSTSPIWSNLNLPHLPASLGISRHLPAAVGAVAKLWLQVRCSCPSEASRCVEWSAVAEFLTSQGTAIHRKLLPEIVRRTSQNYQNCLSIPCNTLQTHQAECMQTASRITMHHDASSKFMQISQLSD